MNKVSQQLYGIKGLVNKAAYQKAADDLLDLGERMIKLAAETKDYTNRTGNLITSYGCCLYTGVEEWKGYERVWDLGMYPSMGNMPGKKIRATHFTTPTDNPGRRYYDADGLPMTMPPKKMRTKKGMELNPDYSWEMTGFEAIEKLFDDFVGEKGKWMLVIAAAMPYATILESGKRLKRKYKVISGITTALASDAITHRYNGRITNFDWDNPAY